MPTSNNLHHFTPQNTSLLYSHHFPQWYPRTSYFNFYFHRQIRQIITCLKPISYHVDWVKVLCLTWHKTGHFGHIPPRQSLGLVWKKLNLTQQKHAFTDQKKCTITQNKCKKIKPGLVASYNIWPGNREGLFLFWYFINLSLTYLDTYPLTYSPGAHMGLLLCSFSALTPLVGWQEGHLTRKKTGATYSQRFCSRTDGWRKHGRTS